MKLKQIALALFLSSFFACHKEEPDVIKLDYTKYYESTAYALASAKKNYSEALKTKDTSKIALAKKQLDAAQKYYGDTGSRYGEPVRTQETEINKSEAGQQPNLPPQPVPEKPKTDVSENIAPAKAALSAAEKRKLRRDSINRKNIEKIEALRAKAKSDLQKDTVKNRLNRFNKSVKDFFEGKIKKK